MNLNQYPAPINFQYQKGFTAEKRPGGVHLTCRRGRLEFSVLDNGLVRIRSTLARTEEKNYSRAGLSTSRPVRPHIVHRRHHYHLMAGDIELQVNEQDASFEFKKDGKTMVRSAEAPFGISGPRSILLLDRPRNPVVYGLGQKTGGLDKSNQSFKMWNVDVVAEFPKGFMSDDYDPAYISIPFLISKHRGAFYGLYIDNPYCTFFHTGSSSDASLLIPSGRSRSSNESVLAAGALEGLFDCYLIPGPTLAEVVRGYARLTGVHAMPPIWSLGYQQCRWGYRTAAEVARVARKLAEEKIPLGGLWLDIDYMEGYRSFTFNRRTFNQEQRENCFREIKSRGSRIVTIIDPGVKVDPGFKIYREGMQQDLFCKTPEGLPFKGYVWPGETVFPDFSLDTVRDYWAGLVRDHLNQGVDGIWNDMNDPSCGSAELDDMLFEKGRRSHATYHNQYAHLMAQATWEGFQRHDPNRRPFVLSRSGSAGSQKYAALWTGDNVSNPAHLKMSIPMSLNLSLSGISFNGPDVGGFGFDTDEQLMVEWMKAGALFPFFRNHSSIGTRAQEPYAFSRKALSIIRKCIHTRAKLLPYLYLQFFLHRRDGDPVMRPLSYEFRGSVYERIDDQYLIGPSLMVAPFVELEKSHREVLLPPGWWFSMQTGKWVNGGRTIRIVRENVMSLFVRDGSILPCIEGDRFFPQPDFNKIEFHVFAKTQSAETSYYEDDGETLNYRNGEYNLYRIEAPISGRTVKPCVEVEHRGMPPGIEKADFYFYGKKPPQGKQVRARWPFGRLETTRCRVEFPGFDSSGA